MILCPLAFRAGKGAQTGVPSRVPGARMTTHPELPVEQAYLDRAYAHLARMRARTKQVL